MSRPRRWMRWAEDTFGPIACDQSERARRFLEEAVEASQAAGIDRATLDIIVDRVYARTPGQLSRELGQVQACLECMALVAGVDLDAEATAELVRVQAIPRSEWLARHRAKIDLGIAAE
jgi:hypothetical protein